MTAVSRARRNSSAITSRRNAVQRGLATRVNTETAVALTKAVGGEVKFKYEYMVQKVIQQPAVGAPGTVPNLSTVGAYGLLWKSTNNIVPATTQHYAVGVPERGENGWQREGNYCRLLNQYWQISCYTQPTQAGLDWANPVEAERPRPCTVHVVIVIDNRNEESTAGDVLDDIYRFHDPDLKDPEVLNFPNRFANDTDKYRVLKHIVWKFSPNEIFAGAANYCQVGRGVRRASFKLNYKELEMKFGRGDTGGALGQIEGAAVKAFAWTDNALYKPQIQGAVKTKFLG